MEPAVSTIALLERDPDTCEMLQFLLASAGFRVHGCTDERVATSGFDLSVLVGAHDPAVVIRDVPPPYHANWKCLRRLMDAGPLANRPVVVTTTSAGMPHVCRMQEPAVEILSKPYDLEVLMQCVTRGHPAKAGAYEYDNVSAFVSSGLCKV